ncbi:hypothetical protein V2J09_009708 [Rumex salicifolius]
MDETHRPDEVLGSFDASNYVTERKFATASDGVQICVDANFKLARLPMSVVVENREGNGIRMERF